jgi:predicted PurR-regulated permease PerM
MTVGTAQAVATRVLPWVLFASLVVLLRHFWALIFLTYIVGSLMSALASRIHQATGGDRRRALVVSYLTLVAFVSVTLMAMVPRAWREGMEFARQRLPAFRVQVTDFLKTHFEEDHYQERISNAFERSLEELSPAKILLDAAMIARWVGNLLLFAFLAVILSLLVLWDPTFAREGLAALERTRLGWIYSEVAPAVAAFFTIVGKVFDAQIIIAVVNTTFTMVGMLFLGIPGAQFLSVIVFVCGLIPVVGAFLSSIPILISALVQPSGLVLVIKGVAMILVVHALEAYVLNPRIMGGHLKMHPFTVILTLVVAEHFFGLWGVLMGVPAVTYVVHQVRGSTPAPAPQAP